MKITAEVQDTITDMRTDCHHQRCKDQAQNIENTLLQALASPMVDSFTPDGEWLLNDIHPRPAYLIQHTDSRSLRIAFTFMCTIMVFSRRRPRHYTHCRPQEFAQRMREFLSPEPDAGGPPMPEPPNPGRTPGKEHQADRSPGPGKC